MIPLTLFALGLSRSALACDCEFDPPSLPARDATEVPTNAAPVVRLMGDEADAAGITLSNGEDAVPFTLSTWVTDYEVFALLTPDSSLPAGASLTLGLPFHAARPFTVGSDADTTAPDVPTLGLEAYELVDSGAACFAGQSIEVTLTGDADEPFLWFEVELGQQPDLSDAMTFRSPEPSFHIGAVGCGAANFVDYAPGLWFARAAAVDLAGNRSGWSDIVSVDGSSAPDPTDSAADSADDGAPADCGCASAPDGASVAGALAGLLLWGRRRRYG